MLNGLVRIEEVSRHQQGSCKEVCFYLLYIRGFRRFRRAEVYFEVPIKVRGNALVKKVMSKFVCDSKPLAGWNLGTIHSDDHA